MIAACAGLLACGGSGSDQAIEGDAPKSMYVPEYEKGLLEKAQTFFQVLPEVAESNANEVTDAKVALGKTLYLDTRLSKDGNNSCNSCHMLDKFGVDNEQFSDGDLGGVGDRNSPTVYNAALHTSQFWDGRAGSIEEQAGMPILNPVEMNIPNEAFLVERLKGIDEYQEMFASAFPDDEDAISYENITLAIGAFERTLMTPSHFDDYLGRK